MSQILATALAKLLAGAVAVSAFTPAQRRALEELARTAGGLRVQTEGRGSRFRVDNADLLASHLRALRPLAGDTMDPELPLRAANIGHRRDSKGGRHGHALHYLLIKAIAAGATWTIADASTPCFDLAAATASGGAGALPIATADDWQSAQPLWLVENQALFDRLDWLPATATGTLHYYAGQLPERLLQWLAARARAPQVILFPDYDGVGLLNYARLREVCASPCSFWLMPGWGARLSTYGSNQVWRDTQSQFRQAVRRLEALGLEDEVAELCQALSREGLALEHEAVWLPPPAGS